MHYSDIYCQFQYVKHVQVHSIFWFFIVSTKLQTLRSGCFSIFSIALLGNYISSNQYIYNRTVL